MIIILPLRVWSRSWIREEAIAILISMKNSTTRINAYFPSWREAMVTLDELRLNWWRN